MMHGYYGLPTRVMASPHLQVEFLAEAGPRIVRLMLAGSDENLLAEVPDLHWPTPYGEYYPRGGHRLWHAPEASARSSIPDDDGLSIAERQDGVRLCGAVESPTGIRKCLDIQLSAERPEVILTHTLHNSNLWPVELAPWAITQLPLGGAVVLPQRPPQPREGNLLPDRHLVLWPYARWRDDRLCLDDEYILVQARSGDPFKAGYLNLWGWAGYVNGKTLFLKRFEPRPDEPHADMGCNVEVYCNQHFVELETLGPLCRMEPGGFVTHVEKWDLVPSRELWTVEKAVRTANGEPCD